MEYELAIGNVFAIQLASREVAAVALHHGNDVRAQVLNLIFDRLASHTLVRPLLAASSGLILLLIIALIFPVALRVRLAPCRARFTHAGLALRHSGVPEPATAAARVELG